MPKHTYAPQRMATERAHPTAPCLPRLYIYGRGLPPLLWLCLLLVIVVGTILLTACGGNGASNTPAAPAPTSAAQTPTADASSLTPTIAQPTPTPVQGTAHTIMISDGSNGSYGFTPAVLTVKVGTTITWKNMSSAPHTVTSDDGQTFDSGNVAVGATFHFTFTTAGPFSYHCNIHPYMRATIIVV